MNIEKYEKLVAHHLDDMTDTQLIKLYDDINKKVKQGSYNRFVDYNNKDTDIVVALDNKLNFIQAALSFAHISRSNPSDIFATVKPWDNMLYSHLHAESKVIPPNKFNDEESEKYMGGYVKEPKLGRTNWIVTVDATALYPSLIMMFNMSSETLRITSKKDVHDILNDMIYLKYDTKFAHQQNYCITANGTMYDKSFDGIIPKAMKLLFDSRDDIKNEMKKVQREYEDLKSSNKNDINNKLLILESEIARLDALQYAYKILANSGYGAVGNSSFRYYKRDIAEGITSTGQLAIKYMSRVLNDFLNKELNTQGYEYVIYCDTDSIFLTLEPYVNSLQIDNVDEIITHLDNFTDSIIEPHIDLMYNKLNKYLNGMKNMLIMKREAIGDCAIFRAKKNYIVNVYDNEHVRYATPKLKMMGIETNRTSTPQLIRFKLTHCIQLIVENKEDELREVVKNFRHEYRTIDPNIIAYPSGVNGIEKWTGEDSHPMKGTPKHVRGAIVYNNFVNSNSELKKSHPIIKSGSKIRYIDLMKGNPLNSSVISFPNELPPEFNIESYIDRSNMFEVTFMNPLESFTSLLNYNIRHKKSIFNFDSSGSNKVSNSISVNSNTTTEVITKRKSRKTFF